jgi:diamine N-acetyltransferase
MQIRKIILDDLPQLLDISRITFIEAFAHQNNPDDFNAYVNSAFTLQTLENELNTEGVSFYFLENEDLKTIGYFKTTANKSPLHTSKPNIEVDYDFDNKKAVELDRIYVISAYHGKGAAQFMMDFIIKDAQEKGTDFVWLGVWEHNPKAIKFYQKYGFERFGTHIFDVGNDPQTDWMMWCKLGERVESVVNSL